MDKKLKKSQVFSRIPKVAAKQNQKKIQFFAKKIEKKLKKNHVFSRIPKVAAKKNQKKN